MYMWRNWNVHFSHSNICTFYPISWTQFVSDPFLLLWHHEVSTPQSHSSSDQKELYVLVALFYGFARLSNVNLILLIIMDPVWEKGEIEKVEGFEYIYVSLRT